MVFSPAHFKTKSTKNETEIIHCSNEAEIQLSDGARFSSIEKVKRTERGPNPVTHEMEKFVYGEITDKNNQLVKGGEIKNENGKYSISFDKDGLSTVFIKAAVSYISPEQAKKNFQKEFASVGFEEFVKRGKTAWKKVINKIQVEGGTEAQKRTFYTSLYRTHYRMIDINEGGRYFSGYDGKVHDSDRPFYVDDAIWDTYNATHPLRTILSPEMENDMLNSYVLMYEQSGAMPTFPGELGNRMCMNSYHTVASFIDGYRKGLRDYNVEKAYEGTKKNLTQETLIPWRQGKPRQWIDDFFHENGYFPALRPGEKETIPLVDAFEKRQPIPVTLGVSFDFWALSEFAEELGKDEEHERFFQKSKNYKNLWNTEHQLFMPKDVDGQWIDIDPKFDGGPGGRDYYDENNGYTYAWDVKHDIPGLIELNGGRSKFEENLDQLFREGIEMSKYKFWYTFPDQTGLVGQFSMGNEPSFHIPYLYNYVGSPWKTQKKIRLLLDVWYKDNIFGIPGDEDGGGMTAFVVFSMMGFYPVTPGIPVYTIGSPVFEKVTIDLENGKKFTLTAKGASKKNKYIQKAFINGEEIQSPFITHEQIMSGATLELILSEMPNKDWGKDVIPPL